MEFFHRLSLFVRACIFILIIFSQNVISEEIRDYYSEPGINPFKDSINQHFNEQIDPFSGTLQLKYSDISIPGNGGMDINIVRTYTSLQTNEYPKVNPYGIGWTMHFGRIVTSKRDPDKLCNQTLWSVSTKDNPSLELPDGGRELLVIDQNNIGTYLITRSNWRAKCHNGGMLVTSPEGTQYVMDYFNNFEGEPSWFTTRIEDINGNWIRIEYETNNYGYAVVKNIYRSEEGDEESVVSFAYRNPDSSAIELESIATNGQVWKYFYEVAEGHPNSYKQLVRVERPDGLSWIYKYNGRVEDPDPSDEVYEDGLGSYSLKEVSYPLGSKIEYEYQYVQFDQTTPIKTTSIKSKKVSGAHVVGGLWTYEFSPSSHVKDDIKGDVTTIVSPTSIEKYYHYGKWYELSFGSYRFIRPTYVGLKYREEKFSLSNLLMEQTDYSWGSRKISSENYFHGGGHRVWWLEEDTYSPILLGQYTRRDGAIASGYNRAVEYSEYDEYGNPGKVLFFSNQSGSSKIIRYTYFNDPAKWLIGKAKNEFYFSSANDTLELGRVTREFDEKGRLTSQTSFGIPVSYTYYNSGDIHTVTDARENVTRYQNYVLGIAKTEVLPNNITIQREVNPRGTLKSETDGTGDKTLYEYDELDRLSRIDYPIHNDVTVDYQIDNGLLKKILTRGSYVQTDEINDFGKLLKTTRFDTSNNQAIVKTFEYDHLGKQLFTSYPNQLIGVRTEYDSLGRVLKTAHPDGTHVRYGYADTVVDVFNEKNIKTTYQYRTMGVGQGEDELIRIDSPEKVTTLLHKDIFGNTTKIFQGELISANQISGYEKTYKFNAKQQLEEFYEPEVGRTVFEYDLQGNINLKIVNGLSKVLFEYDELNRRKRESYFGAAPDVFVEYDNDGNIKKVTKGIAEQTYTYDENNNLKSEVLTIADALIGNKSYSLNYQYDNMDVLSALTYPSGLSLDFAPDAFGRATKAGTFATNVNYHPSGQVAGYTLANGTTVTIDINQRLLTSHIRVAGGAGNLVDLNYEYDDVGNVTDVTDAINPSQNVSMDDQSYDGLDRLKKASGAWGTADYSYDVFGNIKTNKIGANTLSHYHDETKRVSLMRESTQSGVTKVNHLDYDSLGNIKANFEYSTSNGSSILEKSFKYDGASQLIKAKVSNNSFNGNQLLSIVDYTYDGSGNRIIERAHGKHDTKVSIYSRSGQLMYEDDISSCLVTDYIRLGALSIAKSDDKKLDSTVDADNDNLPDCFEQNTQLNPNNNLDASADADGDGISNLLEYQAGTSLRNSDTDQDGISDFLERNIYFTDPLTGDSDGDGLADSYEIVDSELNANLGDTDHDGVSDSWEKLLQTNPKNGSDALLDTDFDGFSNRQESLSGFDPAADSSLPVRGTVAWNFSVPGRITTPLVMGKDKSVYVIASGNLYAISPDGSLKWKLKPETGTAAFEPSILPDGTVILTSRLTSAPINSSRSFIYALNPENGQLKWKYETKNDLDRKPVVGPTRIGFAYSLTTISGQSIFLSHGIINLDYQGILISSNILQNQVVTNLVRSYDETSYFATNNGDSFNPVFKVQALAENGTSPWTYTLRAAISGKMVLDADSVYVNDSTGYLYALSKTGLLKWEKKFSPTGVNSDVAFDESGALLLVSGDGKLRRVNSATGDVIQELVTNFGNSLSPIAAKNNIIYLTSMGGLLRAVDANGVTLWDQYFDDNILVSPLLDQDGSLYVATSWGRVKMIIDNSPGLLGNAWPMPGHDFATTNHQCFDNQNYSFTADADQDGIDNCTERKLGLNPNDPADAALDADNDGLTNLQEFNRGTSPVDADSDDDGLNDGAEVLVHNTNPLSNDSDGDSMPDNFELSLGLNPLDQSDVFGDLDGDGHSNRVEFLLNTALNSAASKPNQGAVISTIRNSALLAQELAVTSQGNFYKVKTSTLEAFNQHQISQWTINQPTLGYPLVSSDGSIHLLTTVASGKQNVKALFSNGRLKWNYNFDVVRSQDGVNRSPVLGADNEIYFVNRQSQAVGDQLIALKANGAVKWKVILSARNPKLSVDQQGNILTYDPKDGVRKLSAVDGALIWHLPMTVQGSVNKVWGPIFIAQDKILLGDELQGIIAVNLDTGTQLWTYADVDSEPVIDANNQIIVACGTPSKLCAISVDGQLIWTSAATLQSPSVATVDNNGFIYLAGTNKVMGFNHSGALVFERAISGLGSVFYPMVMPDGTLYISAQGVEVSLATGSAGLAQSPWPIKNGDSNNSRNQHHVELLPAQDAPNLLIESPGTGLRVDIGTLVNLRAVAMDAQQGDISETIQWQSSRDGNLGTGKDIQVDQLTRGLHTIQAEVIDQDGNIIRDSINIEVDYFPPELDVISPTNGQIVELGASLQLSASAFDEFDGDISNRIQWHSSLNGLLGEGNQLSINNLSAGTHLLTASVTDSHGVLIRNEVTIQLQVIPPVVVIETPSNQQTIEAGTPLVLRARANDGADGNISQQIIWHSNRVGELGVGASIEVNQLTPGTHIISAKVTDSSSQVAQVNVQINVVLTPPELSILSPQNGENIEVGSTVVLSAEAIDLADGNLNSRINWFSNLDGNLGVGSNLTVNSLSPGNHSISVKVTDNSGQTRTENVYLTVTDPNNSVPEVFIFKPSFGSVHEYYEGDPVAFQVSANDSENGNVANFVVWRSDRDGIFATGSAPSVTNLSVGTHQITAIAVDAGGAKDSHTITIEVLPTPENFAPEIKIFSPLTESYASSNRPVLLVASATDREEGDLSSNIQWISSEDGVLGSGSTVYANLSEGTHQITARVVDQFGDISENYTYFYVHPDYPYEFLYEAFNEYYGANVLNGWKIVDDQVQFPSYWYVSNAQELIEVTGTYGGSTTAADIPKPGTYVQFLGGDAWTDIVIEFDMVSNDNDAFGIMFRYIDDQNYYRFSMDSQNAYRRLVKKQNGVYTTLWQDNIAYPVGVNQHVMVNLKGDEIIINVNDEEELVRVNDSSFKRGGIALYSWNQANARFDNVRVADISESSINTSPYVRVSAPVTHAVYPLGREVLMKADAVDREDGSLSSVINWSSDVEGLLGVGKELRVSNLRQGTHKITANVIDSNGVQDSTVRTIVISGSSNDDPQLSIQFPATEVYQGESIELSATAIDVQDGNIAANVIWTSNLDGEIGRGSPIARSNLRVGKHLLTAEVMDSAGARVIKSVALSVKIPGNDEPNLNLQSPGSGQQVSQGDTVIFSAFADDLQDGSINHRIIWQSNLDGLLGTGGSLSLNTLSVGDHIITVRVTDLLGSVVQDELRIKVNPVTNIAPILNVTSPNFGANLTQGTPVNFAALAIDMEDGNVSANIQWSSNLDGALGSGGNLSVPLSGGYHVITASVSDAQGVRAINERTILVNSPGNTAPFAQINSPANNSSSYLGDTINFNGAAYDNQEGVISSRLQWLSDRDGLIATGASFNTTSLSVGDHQIRAVAADNAGAKGAATVSIKVLPIPDNFPPELRLSSPGLGSRYLAGDNIIFQAAASDRESGDITSLIEWKSNLSGVLGTGGRISVSTLPAGQHQITASVIDAGGAKVDYRFDLTVHTTGESILFETTFDSVDMTPWSILDEGTSNGPSNWNINSGALLQNSAIYGGSFSQSSLPKPGTMALNKSGYGWRNYALSFKMTPRGANGTGVVFRYKDNNNYYRLSVNSAGRRLVKKQNGTFTLLYENTQAAVTNQTYQVDIDLVGSQLTIKIDGVVFHTRTDNSVNEGTFGFYTWATAAMFDDVIVKPVVVPNVLPVLTISQPLNSSYFYLGDTINFVATATDNEDGNLNNSIQWHSSIDGVLGVGPSLQLSWLQPGVHTITASVTDTQSGNVTITRSVEIDENANTVPSVLLISPPDQSTYTAGDLIELAATALDVEDGELSGSIVWTSNLQGELGRSAELSVSNLQAGVHTITASVTDSGGLTHSASITITISPAAPQTLLSEDFSSGSLTGWVVVDEGTTNAPSTWSVVSGSLRQMRDIYGGSTQGSSLPKPGTYIRYNAGNNWTNYRVTLDMRSVDDDVVGVIFRLKDNNNYYRFSMDRQRPHRRLVKKVNGTFTAIQQDTVAYTQNQTYQLDITVTGSSITIKINGQAWYQGTDSAVNQGSIGLYSWNNNNSQFDNIVVTTAEGNASVLSTPTFLLASLSDPFYWFTFGTRN